MRQPITVLAISSSVAAGHVGLSAIVPTLQAHGVNVAAVPTVVLSNHPALAHCGGTRVSAASIDEMIDALSGNGVFEGIETILTGYLPTVDHVQSAERAIECVRRYAPNAQYICDPVLGDDPKGLYIDSKAAEAVRDRLVPLADVLLPNRFELSWLAEAEVTTIDEAIAAGQSMAVSRVIAKSVPAKPGSLAVVDIGPADADEYLVPRFDGVPKGTGDVFSGLIAAKCSVNEALFRLQSIIVSSLGQDHLELIGSRFVAPGRAGVSHSEQIGSADHVTGVDGCRGGWIAVTFPANRPEAASCHVFDDFEALLIATAAHRAVAVDIPIGLPVRGASGGRDADREARSVLGERRSSVFSVPARAAVGCEDYWEACKTALAHSDPPRKVAKQTFNLFPKIREVDAVMTPELQSRVVECHPEVAFWALNDQTALSLPKKIKSRPSEPGLSLRRDLLCRAGFQREFVEGKTLPDGRPGLDDFLDACAAAWTANRVAQGCAGRLPEQPPTDARGLRMEIVY